MFTWAARRGNTERAQLPVLFGANADVESMNCSTALILAAAYGRTECVQPLVDVRANVEAQSEDGYCIDVGCTYGRRGVRAPGCCQCIRRC